MFSLWTHRLTEISKNTVVIVTQSRGHSTVNDLTDTEYVLAPYTTVLTSISTHHQTAQTVCLPGIEVKRKWLHSPLCYVQELVKFCITSLQAKKFHFAAMPSLTSVCSCLFLSLEDFTLLMDGDPLNSSQDGLTFNLYPFLLVTTLSGNSNNFLPFLAFALPFVPLPWMYL